MARVLETGNPQAGVTSMLQVREVELSNLKPWEDDPRLNDQAVNAVVRPILSSLEVQKDD